MKSLTEQLAAARRELAMRQRVYPKWINAGKLTPAKATHEVDCMDAIVQTLERALELETISAELRGPDNLAATRGAGCDHAGESCSDVHARSCSAAIQPTDTCNQNLTLPQPSAEQQPLL